MVQHSGAESIGIWRQDGKFIERWGQAICWKYFSRDRRAYEAHRS